MYLVQNIRSATALQQFLYQQLFFHFKPCVSWLASQLVAHVQSLLCGGSSVTGVWSSLQTTLWGIKNTPKLYRS